MGIGDDLYGGKTMAKEDVQTVMLDVDNSHDIDCIKEYTHDTCEYAKKIYNIMDDEKEEYHMGGSNVAEIIAARDRGDIGGRYHDNDNNGGNWMNGLFGGMIGGSIFNRDRRGDGDHCCVNPALTSTQNSLTEVLSDFNAVQHSQTLGAINASGQASVAATHQASLIEGQRDFDRTMANGFLQSAINQGRTDLELAKGFGNVSLEGCRQTGIITTAIGNVEKEVLLQGKDNIIEAMRTQNLVSSEAAATRAEVKDCCCKLEMQAEMNKNAILNQMCADREADAARREQELRFELLEEKRCRDNDRASNQIINLGTMVGNAIDALKMKVA